jgi:hypothetical protein
MRGSRKGVVMGHPPPPPWNLSRKNEQSKVTKNYLGPPFPVLNVKWKSQQEVVLQNRHKITILTQYNFHAGIMISLDIINEN